MHLETKADHQVTVTYFSSFDEMSSMKEKWDRFVESVNGDIYLTYDWCRIWWDHYRKGRRLKVYVFWLNREMVGIIPMFVETIWLGPVWLRIAKIVGSDSTMVIVNPPVRVNVAAEIYGQVCDLLTKKEGCDAVWFGPVAGQYAALPYLRDAIKAHPQITMFQDSIWSPHTAFGLPKTFDDYIKSLNKRQRGNLRRDLNLINKNYQVTQDVVQDETTAITEYEKFVLMHNKQWEAEGKLGHFNDWPLAEAFNAKLVTEQAKHGRLRLIRLLANDKVVSYQLCFSFGNRWYWRLPARLVGPEWSKFGLGRIGLIKEIELAIAEGVEEIEAGAGHYDYKVKLGGVEHNLRSILAANSKKTCQLRASLFLRLSRVLHFVYYRVWFCRFAVMLPFNRKPLWQLWIRSRI